jgi:hypothetical protein
MAPTLRNISTARVSGSIARLPTPSQAYPPCYNVTSRNYNTLLGPWRTLEHNEHIQMTPASSSLPKSARFRSIHTRLSDRRSFSISNAVQISKARYDKLRLDPDALRAHLARSAQNAKRRFDSNPEARQRHNETAKIRHAHLSATQKDYIAFRKLHSWVYTYTWIRETLPWKSHHPLIYDEPVKHYCNSCRATKRTEGEGTDSTCQKPADALRLSSVPRSSLHRKHADCTFACRYWTQALVEKHACSISPSL